MQVKINKKAFTVTEGASVEQALRDNGFDPDTHNVYVNGQLADMEGLLNDNATITLMERAQGGGGQTMVKVGKLPGKLTEVRLTGQPTVRAALAAAGLNPQGYEIMVNGSPVQDLDTVVTDGAGIALVTPVEGNADDDARTAWLELARSQFNEALEEYIVEAA